MTVENPAGSVRSGIDETGREWSQQLNNTYGYIPGTMGTDGDQIDVFLGPDPLSQKIYVIDQRRPDGSFDEHKVMLGFDSQAAAAAAYQSNYEPGWPGMGGITETDPQTFSTWVESGKRRIKPFADYKQIRNLASQEVHPTASDRIRFRDGNTEASAQQKAVRIEKLRQSAPVEITGQEIEPSDDLRQYKANAKEYGRKLRGVYTNKDTGGRILLARDGVNEVLQHDYKDVEQLQSVAAIPQIIENAIFIDEWTNHDKGKHPDIQKYQYYVAGLKIAGVDYTVRAVISVSNFGEKYYDHKLTQIEKGELLAIADGITNPSIANNSPLSKSKDTILLRILQTGPAENKNNPNERIRFRDGEEKVSPQQKAVRIEKLRRSAPVEITGREIEPSEDLRQYKRNALEYGKTLRNEYVNQDTGLTISLGLGGVKEVLQHDYKDVEQLQSVAAIPQIIERATYITTVQNEKRSKDSFISAYDYYVCGLSVAGVPYTVRASVAVAFDGRRYYDHKLTRIEKGELIDLVNNIPQIKERELSATTGITNPSLPNNSQINGFMSKGAPEGAYPSDSVLKDTKLFSILQINPDQDAGMPNEGIGFRGGDSIEAEKADIVSRAKTDGTYLKAPNGKPTNLMPEQWVAVRTRAFKKWFGDWEKVARIEKLRQSAPVEITGRDIEPSDDLRQYKRNALEYGKTLRGEYVNRDTGLTISLGLGGVKEVLQHDYKDVEQLQSIAAIPRIIESAIYIDTLPNRKTEKHLEIKEYQYYVAGLNIGGIDYTVRAVIAVSTTGEKYYDHKLTQIEKNGLISAINQSARYNGPASSELSSTTESGEATSESPATRAGEQTSSPVPEIKDKTLLHILQINPAQDAGMPNEGIRFRGGNSIEAEKAEIVSRAKADGTYLKAPNGKPSRLTPQQWATVRTRAFKKWFGDWEKVERIEKLRQSAPVEITGWEIEPSEDLRQYKANAKEYGRKLRGVYTNKDTGGRILLARDGVNEVLQHDYMDVVHLQSVAAIPQIIENSIYIDSFRNEDAAKHPEILSYDYYIVGLKVGGVDYTVKAVIANAPNGERYYDHKLTQIEKNGLISAINQSARYNGPASSGLSSTTESGEATSESPATRAGEQTSSPVPEIKDRRLVRILQANSSKVVDQNGEPLVVYHGTNADFTVFNENQRPFSDPGIYFSDNEQVARAYMGRFAEEGRQPMAVFLNIRDMDEYDARGLSFNRAIDNDLDLKQKVGDIGRWADGLVMRNIYDHPEGRRVGPKSDVYAVTDPTRIKSATNNEGLFDAEDSDIRFREQEWRQADAQHAEAFEKLAEQYVTLVDDKENNSNFEEDLNDWRDRKVEVVRALFEDLAGRYGITDRIEVFNGAQDQRVYENVARMLNPGISDTLVAKWIKRAEAESDRQAYYIPGRQVIVIDIAHSDDMLTPGEYKELVVHEATHSLVERLFSEKELNGVYGEALQIPVMERIITEGYNHRSGPQKGDEVLAQIMGLMSIDPKGIFEACLNGELDTQQTADCFKFNAPVTKECISKILNALIDGRRRQRTIQYKSNEGDRARDGSLDADGNRGQDINNTQEEVPPTRSVRIKGQAWQEADAQHAEAFEKLAEEYVTLVDDKENNPNFEEDLNDWRDRKVEVVRALFEDLAGRYGITDRIEVFNGVRDRRTYEQICDLLLFGEGHTQEERQSLIADMEEAGTAGFYLTGRDMIVADIALSDQVALVDEYVDILVHEGTHSRIEKLLTREELIAVAAENPEKVERVRKEYVNVSVATCGNEVLAYLMGRAAIHSSKELERMLAGELTVAQVVASMKDDRPVTRKCIIKILNSFTYGGQEREKRRYAESKSGGSNDIQKIRRGDRQEYKGEWREDTRQDEGVARGRRSANGSLGPVRRGLSDGVEKRAGEISKDKDGSERSISDTLPASAAVVRETQAKRDGFRGGHHVDSRSDSRGDLNNEQTERTTTRPTGDTTGGATPGFKQEGNESINQNNTGESISLRSGIVFDGQRSLEGDITEQITPARSVRIKEQEWREADAQHAGAFEKLAEEYVTLVDDKENNPNFEQDLNDWRDRKVEVVRALFEDLAGRYGITAKIKTFNSGRGSQGYEEILALMNPGIDAVIARKLAIAATARDGLISFIVPGHNLIIFDVGHSDDLFAMHEYKEIVVHEAAHTLVERLFSVDQLTRVSRESTGIAPIQRLMEGNYGHLNAAQRGDEVLAQIIGQMAIDEKGLFDGFMCGEVTAEQVVVWFKFDAPEIRKSIAELLNALNDGRKEQAERTEGTRFLGRDGATGKNQDNAKKDLIEANRRDEAGSDHSFGSIGILGQNDKRKEDSSHRSDGRYGRSLDGRNEQAKINNDGSERSISDTLPASAAVVRETQAKRDGFRGGHHVDSRSDSRGYLTGTAQAWRQADAQHAEAFEKLAEQYVTLVDDKENNSNFEEDLNDWRDRKVEVVRALFEDLMQRCGGVGSVIVFNGERDNTSLMDAFNLYAPDASSNEVSEAVKEWRKKMTAPGSYVSGIGMIADISRGDTLGTVDDYRTVFTHELGHLIVERELSERQLEDIYNEVRTLPAFSRVFTKSRYAGFSSAEKGNEVVALLFGWMGDKTKGDVFDRFISGGISAREAVDSIKSELPITKGALIDLLNLLRHEQNRNQQEHRTGSDRQSESEGYGEADGRKYAVHRGRRGFLFDGRRDLGDGQNTTIPTGSATHTEAERREGGRSESGKSGGTPSQGTGIGVLGQNDKRKEDSSHRSDGRYGRSLDGRNEQAKINNDGSERSISDTLPASAAVVRETQAKRDGFRGGHHVDSRSDSRGYLTGTAQEWREADAQHAEAFEKLAEEYVTLVDDKENNPNFEQDLNDWRDRKVEVVRALFEDLAGRYGIADRIEVFNGERNDAFLREMFGSFVPEASHTEISEAIAAWGRSDESPAGFYDPSTGVVVIDVSKSDKKQLSIECHELLIHESTHGWVHKFSTKEQLRRVYKETRNVPAIQKMIRKKRYANASEEEKGEEVLAALAGWLAGPRGNNAWSDFIAGKIDAQQTVDHIRSAMPYTKGVLIEILNAFKDGSATRIVTREPRESKYTGNAKRNRDGVARQSAEADISLRSGIVFDGQRSLEGDLTEPKQITAAAEALAETLGVPVKIVHNTEQIADPNPTTQRRKRRAKGWYDTATGEVVVNVAQHASVTDIEATVLHEVIGHKGLRGLLGERLNDFLDEVYVGLPEDVRKESAGKGVAEQRIAAEEYIASLAEGNVTPSRMARIMARVRELLRRYLGIPLRIDDRDLAFVLWRAKNNLTHAKDPKQVAALRRDERSVRENLYGEPKPIPELQAPRAKDYTHAEEFARDMARYREAERKEQLKQLAQQTKDFVKYAPARIAAWEEARKTSIKDVKEALPGIKQKRRDRKIDRIERRFMQPQALEEGIDPTVIYKKGNLKRGAQLRLIDSTMPVRLLQEEILRRGGQINEVTDVWKHLNHFSSRAKAALTKYEDNYLEPVVDAISDIVKASGMTEAQVIDYITAESSLERHKSGIAALSEDPESPWNIPAANKIVAEFQGTASQAQIAALWKRINAANDRMLDMLVGSGLITPETKKQIKGHRWEYYVPLMDYDFSATDTSGDPFFFNPMEAYDFLEEKNQRFNLSTVVKQAVGRDTKPFNPIAQMVNVGTSAIINAENNIAMQSVLRLARNNAKSNEDLFRVDKVWHEKDKSGKFWTPTLREPSLEEVAMSAEARKQISLLKAELNRAKKEGDRDYAAQIWEKIQGWEEKNIVMEGQPSRDSFGREVPLGYNMERQRYVECYVNGIKYIITFADPAVSNAINTYNKTEIPKWLDNTVGNATRWLASAFTSRNPAFIAVNFLRDVQHAGLTHLLDKQGGNFRGYVANIKPGFAAAGRASFGKTRPLSLAETGRLSVLDAEGRAKLTAMYGRERVMDTLYDYFKENGGETGFVFSKDVKQIEKEIKRRVAMQTGTVGKLIKTSRRSDVPAIALSAAAHKVKLDVVAEAFDNTSEMIENTTRFATFVAMIEKGDNLLDAINYAKHVTVNFNQRGTATRALGMFYVFFNASLQGAAQVGRLAWNNKGPFGVFASYALASGFLNSVLVDLLISAAGGDDDWEISEYDRQSHLIVPAPWSKKGFIKTPLPQGFRAFHGIGCLLYDTYRGKINSEEAVRSIMAALYDDFSPVASPSSKGDMGRVVVPTSLTPFYDIWFAHEDVFGYPVSRKTYGDTGESYPLSEMGLKNVNKTIHLVCRQINYLGGGDEFTPAGMRRSGEIDPLLRGIFEWNPSHVEHVLTYYGGGVGKFVRDILRTGQAVTSAEFDVQARDLPIINRFYGQLRETNPASKYYDMASALENLEAVYKRRQKAGKLDYSDPGVQRDLQKIEAYKGYDKAIRDMRKALKGAMPGDAEFEQLTEQMNEAIKECIKFMDDDNPN